jgi:hypothetical protein
MKRRVFFRSSRATRVGLIIGSATIIAASALTAVASTTSTKATRPSVSNTLIAAPKHTKVPPVKGVTAPALVTRRSATLATPMTASPAALPDSTCNLIGTTRSCDLYARHSTISVPGIAAPVHVWGFSLSASGPATLPGPTIVSNEADQLNITLHNNLPSGGGNLALEIPAAPYAPDLTGAGVGATAGYTYAAGSLKPGTYIYEAGETANAQRQVAMGLTGMLIVRPKNWSPTCHSAYDPSVATACDGTQFTSESPVELSELSTAFNAATNANPTSSDLHNYVPDVFLVNGVSFDSAHPTAGSIPVSAGDQLLLRYADLGLRERSISIANSRQQELASDSNLLKVPPEIDAVYLNPAQTADALTQVDATLPLNTLIPLYDQGQHLTHWVNGTAIEGGGMGGMLAMLNVINGLAGTPAGPKTVVSVAPKTNDLNPGNAGDTTTVSSTITSTTNSPITQAEWFLDNVGAPGTGTPITSSCAPKFCFSIDPTTMQTLLVSAPSRNGPHVIWVHGMDANGWGVAAGDTFSVDLTGPLVTNASVHSTPTNGLRNNDIDSNPPSTNLDLIGTASVSLDGWVIQQAEACVDSPCSGPPYQLNSAYDQPGMSYGSFTTSFSLNVVTLADGSGANDPAGPIVGISGSIPFASLPSTADGTHTFFIHACEAPDANPATPCRWGDTAATIDQSNFVIDTMPPTTTINAVAPDPNNGFQSGPGNVAYLNEERVTATFDDTGAGNQSSPIALAEVFITQPGVLPWCYVGPNSPPVANCPTTPPAGFFGSGAEMVPVGAKWNQSATQTADAFIPLADVRAFPEGHVWFWVHSQDQAGNWAPFTDALGQPLASAYYALTLDKTPPIIDSATTTQTATTTTVTINTHDPTSGGVSSNIAQAEYFIAPCTPSAESSCFTDPGPGNGTPITVPANTGTATLTFTIPTPPPHSTLFVRVKDAAGNWTAVDLAAKDFVETGESTQQPTDIPNEIGEDYGPVASF